MLNSLRNAVTQNAVMTNAFLSIFISRCLDIDCGVVFVVVFSKASTRIHDRRSHRCFILRNISSSDVLSVLHSSKINLNKFF